MLEVLLVEDDDAFARFVAERVLPGLSADLHLQRAATVADGCALLAQMEPDLLLLDVMLPPDRAGAEAGLIDDLGAVKVLKARGSLPSPPATLILSSADKRTAVRLLLENRIDDYLFKDTPPEEIRARIEIALRRCATARRAAVLERGLSVHPGARPLVGASEPMQALLAKAAKVAPLETTVLLQGPTGTGKELLAYEIHRLSPRGQKPFVAVNCAALPEPLLESELFGHVKGAFSGATSDRVGRFEVADGGTLFLDEIGELAPATQAKLLRALQERRIERVGSNRSIRTDFRLVSATNRDLRREVDEGLFRQDLYHRLAVFCLEVPSLAARPGDVPLLVEAFVAEFSRAFAKPIEGLTAEAEAILLAHAWPGNVRELRNVIEHACVLEEERRITPASLPAYLSGTSATVPSFREAMDQAERRLLEEALAACNGKVKDASRRLALPLRTLYRRLAAHGLVGKE